ncbi:hypothetical protein GGR58DRAFT_528888, partial [Xylaria digitata]
DRLAISRTYQASGWTRGRAKLSGTQLHLKGFCMDSIRVIGPSVMKIRDTASLKQTFSQWKCMIQTFKATHQPNDDTFRKQLAKTLCGEVCRDPVPFDEELERLFDTGDLNRLLGVPYSDAVTSSLSYRSLFITENGRLGIGVGHARAGDQVWGVYGSRVPFILRQLNSEADPVQHSMIGDCYLNDAMKGELVRKSVKIRLI